MQLADFTGTTHNLLREVVTLLTTGHCMQDDVASADGPASRSAPHDQVVARTYAYETERACEAHLGTFLRSIEAAGQAPGQGFAAIKVRSCRGRLLSILSIINMSLGYLSVDCF